MAKHICPFELAENFMRDVLVKVGVAPEDAAITADVLVESDKRGHDTHGVGRCKPIYYDRIKKGILNTKVEITIEKETPTTAVIDGHNSLGHVVSKRAMQMAIDKAKKNGLGMVVVRNSTHNGIAGYYSSMAADQGCIGMCGTNARPSIAPTFAVENMLGTNPLCFAFPSDEKFAFNLDCATSIAQRGRVEQYARDGLTLPSGWVIDSHGKPATDPDAVLQMLTKGEAAMAPLGGIGEETAGYKGYGYATVVEVLSAALSSANFLRACYGKKADGSAGPIELGHFFFAADVSAFTDLATFKKNTGDIMRELRTAKLAEGATRIYTAGEKEFEAYHHQLEQGGVVIEGPIAHTFDVMREETGLTQYIFPWDEKYAQMMKEQGKKEGETIYTDDLIKSMCLDPSFHASKGCMGACNCHHRTV
ncbi:putative Ldh family oxidoreductase [Monocercomonoides exilis]|uniref:putative Ldh family oxidoreductase n=1 Tax=Monocercomonoides exilis TaxID=2049356 RepID=UPI0035596785|nr:putative Ldh family oxidoreductase [Monocercomonoides exilis]|eukprot:MONOS_8518.1-p1 / transcript=MONOS_8518.1 / gene=MONOS_8518 / organism=Monocercomonoides_exilis_PA203 / gene_product=Ldh family oxidoreductase / transcript_product=Ldh family oxidoreductase / location=Mono_scaffold00323:43598-45147(+) / protein_length=420 / sequence_SO=supercontig / SO=protein_coding / is_pseudo=false